jgi:pimeloyl-ACP methyl ester carboxylesterase
MATPRRTPFELTGADDGPLRGDVRVAGTGADRPAVIICHGFKGFKDWGFFPHLADRLARAGITAVSFNFSGSGVGPDGESFSEPERFAHATLGNDLQDLTIVCDAVTHGLIPKLAAPIRVGLFGHSRGGGVGVLFSARDGRVASLVTWASIGNAMRWGPHTLEQWRRDGKIEITNARTGDVLPLYTDLLDELEKDSRGELDIPEAATRVTAPWLLVHGEEDEAVPVSEGRQLWERTERRAELLVITHGSHTFGARHPWVGATPELNRAMDATADWFVRTLF